MKIQLVRNATMKIEYAGRMLLTDPMLSTRGALRSFAGIAPNPTVDLPLPPSEIVKGVELVLVSHDHPDHLDPAAAEALPQEIPLFCQPGDDAKMAQKGFRNVTPIQASHTWRGITFTRTGGEHGRGKILERTGKVSGFVLQAEGEPVVYWAGDSIWCEAVAESIHRFRPAVVVTHSGGATLPGFDPIIMDAEQTLEALEASPPETVVVAVHLEALDHCGQSRAGLRRLAERRGVPPSRLRIPQDGETIAF